MANYFAALPCQVPAEVLDSVRAGAPPALRWFHPDDLHLTLAFFGREDPYRIGTVLEVLDRISFKECEVTLGPLRLLPRPRRFTALSFEVGEGRESIADLIATWRSPLLEAAGRPPDERPPLPHLTIARPTRKDPQFDSRRIGRWAHSLQLPSTPVCVRAPVLYGWSHDRPRRQFRILTP